MYILYSVRIKGPRRRKISHTYKVGSMVEDWNEREIQESHPADSQTQGVSIGADIPGSNPYIVEWSSGGQQEAEQGEQDQE